MAGKDSKVRVAALGDLHVRDSSSGSHRELLAEISHKADVLALCGDLTDHGEPKQAELLVEELRACAIPMVAVLGNHDYETNQSERVKEILCDAGVEVLEGSACEIKGVGFAGTKGFAGGFENRMLQPWGEEMIKRFVFEAVNESLRLESALAHLRTEHKVALLHYSPVRQTVEGEPPEIVPFLGSSRLAEPIDMFGTSVAFHGHAHYGSARGETSRGVPVYNAALPLLRRIQPKQPYVLVEL